MPPLPGIPSEKLPAAPFPSPSTTRRAHVEKSPSGELCRLSRCDAEATSRGVNLRRQDRRLRADAISFTTVKMMEKVIRVRLPPTQTDFPLADKPLIDRPTSAVMSPMRTWDVGTGPRTCTTDRSRRCVNSWFPRCAPISLSPRKHHVQQARRRLGVGAEPREGNAGPRRERDCTTRTYARTASVTAVMDLIRIRLLWTVKGKRYGSPGENNEGR